MRTSTSENNDVFFDNLYAKINIHRVPAKRIINCDANKRGEINEIIVTNYKTAITTILLDNVCHD